jgi:hypothetical protein
MSVREEFKKFFDGTRELEREARLLADELEVRNETKPVREGIEGFVKAGCVEEIRALVLGHGATTLPRQDFDAAAAFWYRRGLEEAMNMLDEYLATAEQE